jgi:hypothetical protein
MRNAILLGLLFSLLMGKPIHAQLHIYAAFDRPEALVGDRVLLNLAVDWDESVVWDAPDWTRLGNGFTAEVVSQRMGRDSVKSGSYSRHITLEMQFFDEGYLETESLMIDYYFSGEKRQFTLTPVGITIRLLPDPDTLMPIKDLIREPKKWYDQWLFFLISLVVLGLLLYFFLRGKRPSPVYEKLEEEGPLLSPFEIAWEELNRLESEKLWEQGQIKEFQTQLTGIVRKYLQNRFEVRALEMTTGQVLQALRNRIGSEQTRQLESILTLGDLVKFAKFKPLEALHQEFIAKARLFFKDTANTPPKKQS